MTEPTKVLTWMTKIMTEKTEPTEKRLKWLKN